MTNFAKTLGSTMTRAWFNIITSMLIVAILASGQPALAQTTDLLTRDSIFASFMTRVVPPPPEPPTVQEVLLKVCEDRGYDEDCAKTLLGMLWTESNNISTAIGDNGRARGYFQIHYKLHKISTDCAEDLVCSANWSLSYLESNSYPKYVKYAVQCHNSCGVNNGYVSKVVRYGKMFWNKPLTVTQAASIELALD